MAQEHSFDVNAARRMADNLVTAMIGRGEIAVASEVHRACRALRADSLEYRLLGDAWTSARRAVSILSCFAWAETVLSLALAVWALHWWFIVGWAGLAMLVGAGGLLAFRCRGGSFVACVSFSSIAGLFLPDFFALPVRVWVLSVGVAVLLTWLGIRWCSLAVIRLARSDQAAMAMLEADGVISLRARSQVASDLLAQRQRLLSGN